MDMTYRDIVKSRIFLIRKVGDEDWYVLPTPMEVKPAALVLDATNSGRDNGTGQMFRDLIAKKSKYVFTMPEGMNNVEGAKIANIILGEFFECYVPGVLEGEFTVKKFFNATAAPEIKRIISETQWIYKEWTFTATEM